MGGSSLTSGCAPLALSVSLSLSSPLPVRMTSQTSAVSLLSIFDPDPARMAKAEPWELGSAQEPCPRSVPSSAPSGSALPYPALPSWGLGAVLVLGLSLGPWGLLPPLGGALPSRPDSGALPVEDRQGPAGHHAQQLSDVCEGLAWLPVFWNFKPFPARKPQQQTSTHPLCDEWCLYLRWTRDSINSTGQGRLCFPVWSLAREAGSSGGVWGTPLSP